MEASAWQGARNEDAGCAKPEAVTIDRLRWPGVTFPRAPRIRCDFWATSEPVTCGKKLERRVSPTHRWKPCALSFRPPMQPGYPGCSIRYWSKLSMRAGTEEGGSPMSMRGWGAR